MPNSTAWQLQEAERARLEVDETAKKISRYVNRIDVGAQTPSTIYIQLKHIQELLNYAIHQNARWEALD